MTFATPHESLAAAPAFTAAQMAIWLDVTPRAVRKKLAAVPACAVRLVKGQETAVWTVAALPTELRQRLEALRIKEGCRSIETMLGLPRKATALVCDLARVADAEIERAGKLRDALKPWLQGMHRTDLTAGEMKRLGVEAYTRIFGAPITERHWDFLFTRARRRDAGAENWDSLALYLPDKPAMKARPARVVDAALAEWAESFAPLNDYLKACVNPASPSKPECTGLWVLVLQTWAGLVAEGHSEKAAARRVRGWLAARAGFLAPSRDALLKAFNRRLTDWLAANRNPLALRDQRAGNGPQVQIDQADIDLLRHAAVTGESGRVDTAWRESYAKLSAATRAHYPYSQHAPEKIHQLLNRKVVDALTARHHGKRTLRRLAGGVQRDWSGVHAMQVWVVDDLTSNLELAITGPDGTVSLVQPQIIAVMDSASRKWVGWAISDDKAPTAELVCNAVLDAIKTHGVPKQLGLENGYVFGKSLNVNGKADEQGRTVVAGLGQYGCAIRHFEKMNPMSKSELEKSFDLIQRRMEKHPGYTGRLQMVDAPEEFKKEQRLIRSGKVPATHFRYTFTEGVQVINDLVQQYNAEPQMGHLKGLSPNEAFVSLADKNDPPMAFTPELAWMLANERYRVRVEMSGVRFQHYGRTIRVRGGELVKHLGRELWALIDRRDASMVTFMNLDFSEPFTMEVCGKPSACESSVNPDSGLLASERAKIREHEKAVDAEYKNLVAQHGNPRRHLLLAIRHQPPASAAPAAIPGRPVRRVLIDPQMATAAAQMEAQRESIRTEQKAEQTGRRLAKINLEKNGIVTPERALTIVQSDEVSFLNNFLKTEDEPAGPKEN